MMAKKKNYGRLAKYVNTPEAMAAFRCHYSIPNEIKPGNSPVIGWSIPVIFERRTTVSAKTFPACRKVENIKVTQSVLENQPAPHHDIKYITGFNLKGILPPRPSTDGTETVPPAKHQQWKTKAPSHPLRSNAALLPIGDGIEPRVGSSLCQVACLPVDMEEWKRSSNQEVIDNLH
uniref:Uncharacterized protein n=1 Tax=Fagus sylvatica TaxID=28930 RepID=A0A2N9FPL1_FAGSY